MKKLAILLFVIIVFIMQANEHKKSTGLTKTQMSKEHPGNEKANAQLLFASIKKRNPSPTDWKFKWFSSYNKYIR